MMDRHGLEEDLLISGQNISNKVRHREVSELQKYNIMSG